MSRLKKYFRVYILNMFRNWRSFSCIINNRVEAKNKFLHVWTLFASLYFHSVFPFHIKLSIIWLMITVLNPKKAKCWLNTYSQVLNNGLGFLQKLEFFLHIKYVLTKIMPVYAMLVNERHLNVKSPSIPITSDYFHFL